MDAEDYRIQAQLGNKSDKFQKEAGILQHAVMSSENLKIENGQLDYSDNHVRVATVHTREDLILVISYLQTIILGGKWICWLLFAVVVLLVRIAFK